MSNPSSVLARTGSAPTRPHQTRRVVLYLVGNWSTTDLETARGYAETRAELSRRPVEIRRAYVAIIRTRAFETIEPGARTSRRKGDA
jgi:hypothetical protein